MPSNCRVHPTDITCSSYGWTQGIMGLTWFNWVWVLPRAMFVIISCIFPNQVNILSMQLELLFLLKLPSAPAVTHWSRNTKIHISNNGYTQVLLHSEVTRTGPIIGGYLPICNSGVRVYILSMGHVPNTVTHPMAIPRAFFYFYFFILGAWESTKLITHNDHLQRIWNILHTKVPIKKAYPGHVDHCSEEVARHGRMLSPTFGHSDLCSSDHFVGTVINWPHP